MKNKTIYFYRGSLALVIFACLGYVVKFYPEVLVPFDTSIQTTIRGNLPSFMTTFFKIITVFANTTTQVGLILILTLYFYWKNWRAESYLMASVGTLAAILILGLKFIYQRQRPSISHLVHATGFSFPSGHATGSLLIFGTIMIISHQRITQKYLRLLSQIVLTLLIIFIGVSRIYLGVHYPSDIIGGFCLAFACLNFVYPYYENRRFIWRFQSKQN